MAAFPCPSGYLHARATLVYKGEGYTITWDGSTSWGLELSQGIYYYVLDALGDDPDNRFHKAGFIYLYR